MTINESPSVAGGLLMSSHLIVFLVEIICRSHGCFPSEPYHLNHIVPSERSHQPPYSLRNDVAGLVKSMTVSCRVRRDLTMVIQPRCDTLYSHKACASCGGNTIPVFVQSLSSRIQGAVTEAVNSWTASEVKQVDGHSAREHLIESDFRS